MINEEDSKLTPNTSPTQDPPVRLGTKGGSRCTQRKATAWKGMSALPELCQVPNNVSRRCSNERPRETQRVSAHARPSPQRRRRHKSHVSPMLRSDTRGIQCVPAVDERVADHYRQRDKQPVVRSANDPLAGVRIYNNYIKSAALQMADPTRLLDLGCGRGGDVSKYRHLKMRSLYGVDVSAPSIQEARRRAKALGVEGTFEVCDLRDPHQVRALEAELNGHQFDTVVLFFSIQYLSKDDIDRVMRVARRLSQPGSHLLLTLPSSKSIRKLAIEPCKLASARFVSDESYFFSLESAIDDCPEFIIEPEVIRQIISGLGWEIKTHVGFKDAANLDPVLRTKMGADIPLSSSELQIIALYDLWVARLPNCPSLDSDQGGYDNQNDP
jgi:SAM-dependent methyltransferase